MKPSAFRTTIAAAAMVSLAALTACSGSDQSSSAFNTATSSSIVNTATYETVVAAARSENNTAAGLAQSEWQDLDKQELPTNGEITEAGIYTISGTNSSGIRINAPDDAVVVLVLDNATVSSETTAAISVESAKDVVLYLEGTNTVTGADTMTTEDEVNAAIYATADITIDGTGTLKVSSKQADGINTNDDLTVLNGKLEITAGDDGIRAKDSVTIVDGHLTVTAGGDGIKSDQDSDESKGIVDIHGGTVTIESVGDSIDAITDVIITDATVTLKTTGTDSSSHGIHAGQLVVVDKAQITTETTADGINSDGDMYILDGELEITAGDDGLNAVRGLNIAGGTTTIAQSEEGLEALTITIDGGSVAAHSNDDAINASVDDSITEAVTPQVTINGGKVTLYPTTDGVDSNGGVSVTGGELYVYGPTEGGNGIFDADGEFSITGGTVVGVGNNEMPVTPQGSQSFVSSTLTVADQDTLSLKDSSGAEVFSFTAVQGGSSVFVSADGIEADQTYTLSAGSNETEVIAGEQAGGMGPGGAQPKNFRPDDQIPGN